MSFKEIENKWQKIWEDKEIGKADRDESKKKYNIIWAYATVSGFQHTGHMRGYSYVDAIARYKRMTGHNVLLTAGGHATGNGAIAKANKIKNKDPMWIDDLKARNISDAQIEKLGDVNEFIKFFSKEYIKTYKEFGFLGDWRRFTTTTNPDYSKFIEWQFKKLQQANHIIQKPYYANCCIEHGPVAVDPSEMDLSKGGTAEQTEYTIVKLAFDSLPINQTEYGQLKQYIAVATLRPETMFGQTNVWLDSEIEYVRIAIEPTENNKEIWIASKEFAKKIAYQIDNVKVLDTIKGYDMLGKYCHAPCVDRDVIILPSDFCDPNIGTGIVTSVPSDAPADYVGLHDLQESQELCDKYNLDNTQLKNIELIPIIKSKGFGQFPSLDICKKYNIKSQADMDKLEEAKKEVYKTGFHTGVMLNNAGKYSGMKVTQAKDAMKDDLIASNDAHLFFDLSEEVICRCGKEVLVMRRDNAWFIEYSDEKWTNDTKEYSKEMNFYPENLKENFSQAIEWFSDRACAREGNWLGTKLPFDPNYTIEAISDSTLYPIYYMVSMYVNNGQLKVENLTEEFFDFVFLEKGDINEVSNTTNISVELLNTIKSDVAYWYPLDLNLSGKEHRTVHFPPFLLNHTALLPKHMWPKGIFLHNWLMQAPNQKLSKSKGGAQPISNVSSTYTIDGMRLFYANAASPFSDIYFEEQTVLMYKEKVEKIFQFITKTIETKFVNTPHKLDAWFESVFNSSLKLATEAMEKNEFKGITNEIYMNMQRLFTAYITKGGLNEELIVNYLGKWIKTLGIFTPHIAEECYEQYKAKFNIADDIIATSSWPISDETKINKEVELSVDMITTVKNDIRDILKLIKNNSPSKITLSISPKWKYEFFNLFKDILKETRNPKDIIPKIMATDLKRYGKDVMKLIPSCLKDTSKIPLVLLGQEKEETLMKSFIDEIAKEFSCDVEIILAENCRIAKANQASPGKPAIMIE